MLKIYGVAIALALALYASKESAQVPGPTAPRGEPVVTNALDITLINPPCDEVSKIWVVMDGDENHLIPGDQAGVCHWTATRRTGKFDVHLSSFSLRLGIARTSCHHPIADRTNGKGIGRLEFECCGSDVRRVTIRTDKEMPISYVREVAKDAADRQSVACEESYHYVRQPVDILSVWYPAKALAAHASITSDEPSAPYVERLRIQFGEGDPRKKVPLLIFNHPSITRSLKDNSLTSEQILAAAREQRSQGLAAARQSLSVPADEAQRDHLKKLGLTRVIVTLAK